VFLGLSALAAVAALGGGVLSDALAPPPPPVLPRHFGVPRRFPRPVPAAFPMPKRFLPPNLAREPLPWGTLYDLPGEGNLLALTVDDGASTEVVAAYVRWAQDSGMRLTFFLNGSRPAWTDNADALRPLVASGQVQLANHTWSHVDLTSSSNAEIEDELLSNEAFIRDTYGVEARPYYRPPFGYLDERVAVVASGIGYSQPVMWYGSLADSGEISDAQLMEFATRWMLPQHIVIGHANFLTVTRHFTELADLIRARGLVPVTLDDVFLRP
jgi:peptidoglycan/xylan/chitin deacetylase (PgdA/CDA1 family)